MGMIRDILLVGASLLLAGCVNQVFRPVPCASLRAPEERLPGQQPERAHAGFEHRQAEHEASESHGAGRQTLNLFAGGSSKIGDQDGRTFGLDYEYRLSSKWGIGAFVENVSGLDRSGAAGVQAYWHAYDELILVAGVGGERRADESGAILRVGAAYEFPLGDGWLLSPAVFYDFSESTDLVIYGLNLGYSW